MRERARGGDDLRGGGGTPPATAHRNHAQGARRLRRRSARRTGGRESRLGRGTPDHRQRALSRRADRGLGRVGRRTPRGSGGGLAGGRGFGGAARHERRPLPRGAAVRGGGAVPASQLRCGDGGGSRRAVPDTRRRGGTGWPACDAPRRRAVHVAAAPRGRRRSLRAGQPLGGLGGRGPAPRPRWRSEGMRLRGDPRALGASVRAFRGGGSAFNHGVVHGMDRRGRARGRGRRDGHAVVRHRNPRAAGRRPPRVRGGAVEPASGTPGGRRNTSGRQVATGRVGRHRQAVATPRERRFGE